jgi:hypothetical protein
MLTSLNLFCQQGIPGPRGLRDSGSFAVVFKSLSTDQGVLADERTFPNYSPVYMDFPNRIRGHPGNLLIRNRFFRKFFEIFNSEMPIKVKNALRFRLIVSAVASRSKVRGAFQFSA